VGGLRLVAAGSPAWRRLAAPAAFLLAATLVVALVRLELRSDGPAQSEPPGTAVKPAARAPGTKPAPQGSAAKPRYHTVEAGDTLESIAAATGVTVERLRELNPSLEPTALFIGARIRLR